jgi:hypothetical protein
MRTKFHCYFRLLVGVSVAGLLLSKVQAGEVASGGMLIGAHNAASVAAPLATVVVQSPGDGALRSTLYVSVPRESLALGRGWKACLARAWESNCPRYA